MKEITLAIFASILLIFSSAPMAASQADPAQHKSVKKDIKKKAVPSSKPSAKKTSKKPKAVKAKVQDRN
ncbi:TPA: hypothetical protein LZD78_005826 [Klebsiella oxytoca]|uniref:hypothetical protein n=1 Tax=Klebsiella oxytoca TaxID=571 RepID=UPI0035712704|nr:hypothetical protein [Klebsiella oxytoca]HCB2157731.1 hypothetical protein [Klebsiella oxytoca]